MSRCHGAQIHWHSHRQAVSAESCNGRSLLGLVRIVARLDPATPNSWGVTQKFWGVFKMHFFEKRTQTAQFVTVRNSMQKVESFFLIDEVLWSWYHPKKRRFSHLNSLILYWKTIHQLPFEITIFQWRFKRAPVRYPWKVMPNFPESICYSERCGLCVSGVLQSRSLQREKHQPTKETSKLIPVDPKMKTKKHA